MSDDWKIWIDKPPTAEPSKTVKLARGRAVIRNVSYNLNKREADFTDTDWLRVGVTAYCYTDDSNGIWTGGLQGVKRLSGGEIEGYTQGGSTRIVFQMQPTDGPW